MIPIKIAMKDFLSYANEEFDFSQISCATVTGKNGAGKSSFCTDAITWALYGIGSKGGKNEIDNYVREGADSCTVEFTFELNGNKYKVVRSRNVLRQKSSLAFFLINEDGLEIPLATDTKSETQTYIENTLKMNYKTFTASSMVLQNKSNEFTEGMTDSERKDALFSILDVDSWSDIGKRASTKVGEINGQIQLVENKISNALEEIEKENTYLGIKKQAEKDLIEVKAEKEKQNKIIEDNQNIITQAQELDSRINEYKENANEYQKNIDDIKTSINNLKAKNVHNNEQFNKFQSAINKAQEIISQKETILANCEKEVSLNKEIEDLQAKQMSYLTAKNSLTEIESQGKNWNTNHTKELEYLKSELEKAEKTAKELMEVPCMNNPQFNKSCKLLAYANQAKENAQKLRQDISTKEQENNPFREKYIEQRKITNSLIIENFETILANKKQELTTVQKVSVLKAQLEVAESSMENNKNFMATVSADIEKNNSEIRELIEKGKQIKEKLDSKNAQIEELVQKTGSFKSVMTTVSLAKDTITRLENQENEIIKKISAQDTLLELVEKNRTSCEEWKKQIIELKEEANIAIILQQACGKKGGVPALIIENAVPELENTANQILEKMLDGRLQIKMETQVETKTTKNMQEVFRITVLDDGFERPYSTYSGAEKFIIALSIRIAMSKFLAHRAGASVQLFVLDEGVSCADDENRFEIIEALKKIGSEFAKILFITHIEELKDAFDQKIIVTKDSRGSHIKVA